MAFVLSYYTEILMFAGACAGARTFGIRPVSHEALSRLVEDRRKPA